MNTPNEWGGGEDHLLSFYHMPSVTSGIPWSAQFSSFCNVETEGLLLHSFLKGLKQRYLTCSTTKKTEFQEPRSVVLQRLDCC